MIATASLQWRWELGDSAQPQHEGVELVQSVRFGNARSPTVPWFAAGDEVIEQPTTGKEGGLLVPNPATDDTQVDERVRHRLDVSDARVGPGQGGIHRCLSFDEVAQEPPLWALPNFGDQMLDERLPLGSPRLEGAVSIVKKQLRQVGMIPRSRSQRNMWVPTDQPSQLFIEKD